MKKSYLKNMTFVIILLICSFSFVMANTNVEKIIAYLNGDIRFKFNDKIVQLKDADGTVMTPIVYDGHTYLPARAVAELVDGMYVDYDSKTKTVILKYDVVSAEPYKDAQNPQPPVVKPTVVPDQNKEYAVPEVQAYVDGKSIIVKWKAISDSRLQGYKVVVSKNNEHPVYPEDGYMYWITDLRRTSATIDNHEPYKSGDFGERLTPGEKYYFSVTAVYSDTKVAGNAVRLEFPGQ